jgi:hypothetical protein
MSHHCSLSGSVRSNIMPYAMHVITREKCTFFPLQNGWEIPQEAGNRDANWQKLDYSDDYRIMGHCMLYYAPKSIWCHLFSKSNVGYA